MLEKCKIKTEDYAKFKRDRVEAEVLEKNKDISRRTIRQRAAKAIETIAGNY